MPMEHTGHPTEPDFFELANLRIIEVYLLCDITLISKDRSVKPTASEPPRLRSVNEQRVRDAEVVRLFSCGILPFDESDLCPWTRATLSRSSAAEKQCYRGKIQQILLWLWLIMRGACSVNENPSNVMYCSPRCTFECHTRRGKDTTSSARNVNYQVGPFKDITRPG